MTVKRALMPSGGRAVDDSGRLTPAMQTYMASVQDISGRVSSPIAPLDAGATSAEIIAKINELLTAMAAAKLMHPEA